MNTDNGPGCTACLQPFKLGEPVLHIAGERYHVGCEQYSRKVKLNECTLDSKVDWLIHKVAELECRLSIVEKQITPEP